MAWVGNRQLRSQVLLFCLHSVARREHQDGNRRTVCSQLPANLKAILTGKHNVENDEVVLVDEDLRQRRFTIGRNVYGVSLLSQTLGEHRGGTRLILDQKYAHSPSPNDDWTRSYYLCRILVRKGE